MDFEENSDALSAPSIENIKNIFGDQFETMARLNIDTANDNILLARESLAKKDIENFKRAMHTIKSSSRQFGALKLGNLAEELEKSSIQEDLQEVKNKFSQLVEYNKVVSQHIEAEINNFTNYRKEAENVSVNSLESEASLSDGDVNLTEEFQQLYDCMQSGGYIEIDRLNKLDCQISKEQQEKFNQLKSQVLNFEYGMASGTLNTIAIGMGCDILSDD